MTFFGPDLRNGLPIGLGSVAGFGIAPQFSPASLFAGGTVNGAWYDPSDSTTLFTDRAGTTPCGTPGGGSVVPVGLMLDKSAPAATAGYYSGVFDGTGDGLTTVSNAAFTLGSTGDFTVECWFYISSNTTSYTPLVTTYADWGTFNNRWWLGLTNTTKIAWFNEIGSSAITTSANAPLNAWTHVAVCRVGTTITMYVNGIAQGAQTSNQAYTTNGAVSIGSLSGLADLNGYISNLRIVKGTAVYTAGFTPPTAPLTAITNTSLLTCQNNYFKDNSANNFAVTIAGNTAPNLFNPFNSAAARTVNNAIAANDTTARPELRAVVNLLNGSATLATQSVTTVATTYTLYFTGSGSITLSGTATGTYAAGSSSVVCTAGTLTLTVSGTVTTADLRPANSGAQLPVYQARTDANTYDAVGFPRYLAFNGTSSAMSTPGNVNLSGTDKVTVFAGVRKLAEASYPTIVEFSVNSSVNTGSFSAYTSGSSTPRYPVFLFGTASTGYEPQTYAAPISNVLAVGYDIGAADRSTEVIPRINGVVNQTNPVATAAAGTGNFGSYPLFIGARNNASLFLNGNIYSLIVVGSAVSAGNISSTEQWVAGKVGITI